MEDRNHQHESNHYLLSFVRGLRKPLLFASHNNYANLKTVRDLGKTLLAVIQRALDLGFTPGQQELLKEIQASFVNFESLDSEEKRAVIKRTLKQLRVLERQLVHASSRSPGEGLARSKRSRGSMRSSSAEEARSSSSERRPRKASERVSGGTESSSKESGRGSRTREKSLSTGDVQRATGRVKNRSAAGGGEGASSGRKDDRSSRPVKSDTQPRGRGRPRRSRERSRPLATREVVSGYREAPYRERSDQDPEWGRPRRSLLTFASPISPSNLMLDGREGIQSSSSPKVDEDERLGRGGSRQRGRARRTVAPQVKPLDANLENSEREPRPNSRPTPEPVEAPTEVAASLLEVDEAPMVTKDVVEGSLMVVHAVSPDLGNPPLQPGLPSAPSTATPEAATPEAAKDAPVTGMDVSTEILSSQESIETIPMVSMEPEGMAIGMPPVKVDVGVEVGAVDEMSPSGQQALEPGVGQGLNQGLPLDEEDSDRGMESGLESSPSEGEELAEPTVVEDVLQAEVPLHDASEGCFPGEPQIELGSAPDAAELAMAEVSDEGSLQKISEEVLQKHPALIRESLLDDDITIDEVMWELIESQPEGSDAGGTTDAGGASKPENLVEAKATKESVDELPLSGRSEGIAGATPPAETSFAEAPGVGEGSSAESVRGEATAGSGAGFESGESLEILESAESLESPENSKSLEDLESSENSESPEDLESPESLESPENLASSDSEPGVTPQDEGEGVDRIGGRNRGRRRRRRFRGPRPPRHEEALEETIAGSDGPLEPDEDLAAFVSKPVAELPGVGAKLGGILEGWNIRTVLDAIRYLPVSHLDRRGVSSIAEVVGGSTPLLRVTVKEAEFTIEGRNRCLKVLLEDETGEIEARWSNIRSNYLRNRFKPGSSMLVWGPMVEEEEVFFLQSPESELISSNVEDNLPNLGRIVPLYPSIEGIGQKTLRRIVFRALEYVREKVPDPVPAMIRGRQQLLPLGTALQQAHFPPDDMSFSEILARQTRAQRTIAFHELFFLELTMARRRKVLANSVGQRLKPVHTSIAKILRNLPRLGECQWDALEHIKRDIAAPHPMVRILQSDVGAGAGEVAALSLALAVENGCQAAIVASTEAQVAYHAFRLRRLFAPLRVEVETFTNALRGRARERAIHRLRKGEIQIVVGTQALLQDGLSFRKLGLVILDERGRTGLIQRKAFWKRGANPDLLVMVGSPVPMNLLRTIYGDLTWSVLDEPLPDYRAVKTALVGIDNRTETEQEIRRALEGNRQLIYIVPTRAIRDRNATQRVEELANRLQQEVFPGTEVGFVHHKMKQTQIEETFGSFLKRQFQILVANEDICLPETPRAALMIVERADQVPLATLHQLRGVLGYSDYEASCYLVPSPDTDEAVQQGLEQFTSTNNGFELADYELRTRGASDFLGVRQSGIGKLWGASLSADGEMLVAARREAFRWLDGSPESEDEHADGQLKALSDQRWSNLVTSIAS